MADKKQYDWDLESLLEGKSLEEKFNEWMVFRDKIIKLYPNYLDNLENFVNWLDINYKYQKVSNRLYNYISNHLNEDNINPKWVGWNQKLAFEQNKISVVFANHSNIIIQNEAKIREFLKDQRISHFKRYYDEVFKSKPHILSKAEEELLSKISITTGAIDSVYETLTSSEIKFSPALDSDGKLVENDSIAKIMINLKSMDRTLRKNTWISFNQAYYNFRNTLTQTLYYNYLQLNTYSKIRKFKDYIESCCYDDEIESSLITNLYSQVEKFKTLYINYDKALTKHLKKLLKLEKLEPWDYSIDLYHCPIKYSIEDAKAIALEALSCYGEEYLTVLKRAFDEKWISWLPKPAKHHGAYSIGGTKGLDKMYISMNFDYSIGSVYTLVHELGHSLNSYFFGKKQTVYAHCSIFYAEIASIANEVLLSYYLIKQNQDNQDMLKMVYANLLKDFFATTTRQIIFSNFEWEANKLINEEQPFTYEVISKLYSDMITKYQGSTEKQIKQRETKEPYCNSLATILRISHFYVGNFYVYKYAIGQIVGIYAAKRLYEQDDSFKKRYFDFLSSGTSLSPHDTIKLLGIDLNKQDLYDEVFAEVNAWIEKFKKLK